MLVERQDQLVPLLLCVLDHFPRGVSCQVLHQPTLQGEPEGAGQIEEESLTNKAKGNPLVKGVEHLVPKIVHPSFSGAAALEVLGYVEAAVHPAVVLQSVPAHPATGQVALDWVAEELVEAGHGGEDKEQHAGVLELMEFIQL